MSEAIVAFITKTGGDVLSKFDSGAQISAADKKIGGTAYVLRRLDGTQLGMFCTPGDAKEAFRKINGLGQNVRWEQSDLRGDIENYIGRSGF